MLNRIVEEIKAAKEMIILPHVYADGDALGSCLALGLALKKTDKRVTIYLGEEIPYIYDFLPGRELTAVYPQPVGKFDLAVAVDTGDLERLGSRLEAFSSGKVTVNMDHHGTNTEFAQLNYVDSQASASGEIIYRLIGLLGIPMDAEIATCLYTAISTDTGGFRFSNTTPETHRITAELVEKGALVSDISQRVFETTSLQKVMLMGAAIQSLELFDSGKIAFITIGDETMKNTDAREEDCDGIVNIGRNIRGVEVAVMLRRRENGEVKVNLRSKNYVDVSAVAARNSGGGHKRAAGCTMSGSLEDVKEALLREIRGVL